MDVKYSPKYVEFTVEDYYHDALHSGLYEWLDELHVKLMNDEIQKLTEAINEDI